ncbi:hypothetical protein PG995_010258 [Apiospora arundinis]|uniref:Sna2 integral membrane n=1 Tax=Apiospora arundinis TaxID=335852 RepID=A0ABR2ITF2_9PEZI
MNFGVNKERGLQLRLRLVSCSSPQNTLHTQTTSSHHYWSLQAHFVYFLRVNRHKKPLSTTMCSADCFLAILAILFPPLAVWVKRGLCSADSLINILLCLLGYLPGLLHAWYIITISPEESYDYQRVPHDSEGGRVTYVFVHGQPPNHGGPQRQQQIGQPKPQDQGVMNYGATATNNNSHHAAQGGSSSAAAGSSAAGGSHAPPTYAEAVKGDNKIQTQD